MVPCGDPAGRPGFQLPGQAAFTFLASRRMAAVVRNYQTGYDDGPPVLNSDAFLHEVVSTGPVIGMLFRS